MSTQHSYLLLTQVFDTMLTPPVKKLSFVCIWFSFAFALFLLNRHKKRRTFDSIPNFGFWQGAILGKCKSLEYYFPALSARFFVHCSLCRSDWRGLQCCGRQWGRHLVWSKTSKTPSKQSFFSFSPTFLSSALFLCSAYCSG